MTLDPTEERKKAKEIFESPNIDFEVYLREMEHEILALRFWDVTDLGSSGSVSERGKRLIQIQEEILHSSLETSLEKFSAGTVLGALISAARQYETHIEFYTQYCQASGKLELWSTLFIAPDLRPYLQDALRRVWDLRYWLEDKTNKYFPLVETIIQEVLNNKILSPEEILQILRSLRNDREIFFLVGGLLETNPILHEKVKKHCSDLMIDFLPLLELFRSSLVLLAEVSVDQEVKNFCKLFLVKLKKQ